MKRVFIADDHPMVRGALAIAIATAFGSVDVEEFSSLEDVTAALKQTDDVDMLLLDLRMPGVEGFEGLISLGAQFPELPIVVISALANERLVREAIDLGAVAFIPKSTPRPEVVAALRRIADGESYVPADVQPEPHTPREHAEPDAELVRRIRSLTAQQRKVLRLLRTGKLNKEIAYELDVAETTVKAHVSAILQKLDVYSRTQAVVLANRMHLADFDDVSEF